MTKKIPGPVVWDSRDFMKADFGGEKRLRKQTEAYLEHLQWNFQDNPIVLQKVKAIRKALEELDYQLG